MSLYRVGARVARSLPGPVAQRLPDLLGWPLGLVMGDKRRLLERHLRRAAPTLDDARIERRARQALASYGRYWLESFRLPDVSPDALDAGIEVHGYEHVQRGLDAGKGVILALPHLGGWEWAGFWMAVVKRVPITVVVEAIEPESLFEWFTSFREGLGMKVVPLGPAAGTEVSAALARNEVVCLLSDRDIADSGVEVTFFGERTTLPAGPALLGLRSGAAVLPTAVYFRPNGRHLGVVRPSLDMTREGKLRAAVERITQDLANELEGLIERAPEQWHLLQPNWPSDHEWMRSHA